MNTKNLLYVLCLIECFIFTNRTINAHPKAQGIWSLSIGILISILMMYSHRMKRLKLKYYYIWKAVIFFVISVWFGVHLHQLFDKFPLDYTKADMLPVIEIMCQRWLHHDPVYSIIPEIWNGVKPPYLPPCGCPLS